MTSFRDLLKPDAQLSPAEEQRLASARLADVVRASHLRWWNGSTHVQGDYLLLAVAPYSQYDLALLDLLNERLGSGVLSVPVYVSNLQAYQSVEQVNADFPGIGQPSQSPVAAFSSAGVLQKVAQGKRARDIAAEVLGLSADELSRRVFAEAPSSTNPVPRQNPPPPEVLHVGPLTDGQ